MNLDTCTDILLSNSYQIWSQEELLLTSCYSNIMFIGPSSLVCSCICICIHICICKDIRKCICIDKLVFKHCVYRGIQFGVQYNLDSLAFECSGDLRLFPNKHFLNSTKHSTHQGARWEVQKKQMTRYNIVKQKIFNFVPLVIFCCVYALVPELEVFSPTSELLIAG